MNKQEFIELELKPYADQYVDDFDWEGVWRELYLEHDLIVCNDGESFEWNTEPEIAADYVIDALKHNDITNA